MPKKPKYKKNAYMQRILKDKVLTRLEIIRRHYAREKPPDFAAEFGLTPRNIYYIIESYQNRGWRALIDKR
jgi:hypothetical protein